MRRPILAAVLMLTVLGPIAAYAAEHPILVQSATPAASEGSTRDKAIAIGAGILIGAVAGSALSLRGAAIVGAAAGGVIGAWWYGDSSEFATLEPRKK